MHIIRRIAVFFLIATALLWLTTGCQSDEGRGAMLDETNGNTSDQVDQPASGTGGNASEDGEEQGNTDTPDHEIEQLRIDPPQIALAPGESWEIQALKETRKGEEPVQPSELQLTSSLPQWVRANSDGTITVAEEAPIGVKAEIIATYGSSSAVLEVTVKYSLEQTVMATNDALPVVTNPDSIAVVVNKERSLPSDYRPDDLVEPNVPFSFAEKHDKRLLRKEAAEALERLFAQAEQEGIQLYAVSGFRAYETQRSIYEWNVNQYGEEHANRFSAYPGTSEHQTGLAMDVSSASVGYQLEQQFGDTKEGQWLADNAHLFGFIIRYPEGKEHITGYAYEPWHLRYVGEWIAREVYENDITLEQYFEETIPVWGDGR